MIMKKKLLAKKIKTNFTKFVQITDFKIVSDFSKKKAEKDLSNNREKFKNNRRDA